MTSPSAASVIRRARRRRGLTQSQLALIARTTQSAISRIESGSTVPSFARVTELVELMGLSLEIGLTSEVDLSAVRRNLRLTYEQRWDNSVNAARFVQLGRQSLGVV